MALLGFKGKLKAQGFDSRKLADRQVNLGYLGLTGLFCPPVSEGDQERLGHIHFVHGS